MKITIKTLKNKKFDLEVQDDETVGQIKQRIEHELKLGEAASQKLIHSGHILKDDQTVASAKIMNGDFLVVMVSGAKPGKKEDEPAAPAPVAAPPAQPAPVAAPVAPAPAAAAPASVPPAAAPAQPAPAQAPAAANAAPANAAQAAASNLVMGPAYEEMVNNLMALGFPRDQVVAALRASFNNPDRAAQYLFGGIPDELLAAQAQQPQAGAPAAAGHGAPPAQAHAHPAQGDEAGDMEHEHDNEEDAEMDEEALAGLQNAPELQQLRQLMQQNPQIIPMLLQQLQQSNPQLMQAFGNNPEALLALLGAAGGGGGGGGGGGAPPQGGPGRPHVIQITPEEKRSIDNLEALGFSRRRALEAFLICDRNEELAANYLFDQGNDPEELPQAPPGRQGQGGGGNPPAGGH